MFCCLRLRNDIGGGGNVKFSNDIQEQKHNIDTKDGPENNAATLKASPMVVVPVCAVSSISITLIEDKILCKDKNVPLT